MFPVENRYSDQNSKITPKNPQNNEISENNSENLESIYYISPKRHSSTFLSQLEEDIFILINYIRTNPNSFAKNFRDKYSSKLSSSKIHSINYLKSFNEHELFSYILIPEISNAARDLINNISNFDDSRGYIDINEIDSECIDLKTRLSKYGNRNGRIFETIIFKLSNDEDIIEHILNDSKGKEMLLSNDMKFIGIACDYLPSQQICTVIDIVQDFYPYKNSSKNIIKNNQLIHNKSQQNYNISFADNKNVEYCRSPLEITMNSKIYDSDTKNNMDINSADENINDRFSIAGENYKKCLKKCDTDKLTFKEKMEILNNINKEKYYSKTYKPFDEKSVNKKNVFSDGEEYNNKTNKSNKSNLINKNRYSSYDTNLDRVRIYSNKSNNNFTRSSYNISRETLKNEIKDEIKNEIKNEVLNEIYGSPSSIYGSNKKQIIYSDYFENDNNYSNYNNKSYNNYPFSQPKDKRNLNKYLSNKKYYYNNNYINDNNSYNMNQKFFDHKNKKSNRYKSYDFYYSNEKIDDPKNGDGGMVLHSKCEETYEKIKKDDNPLPYDHSFYYDVYTGNNSFNKSGRINFIQSTNSKKDYKKLVKMYNIMKANKNKNKNNKNNNLIKNSVDTYNEYKTYDLPVKISDKSNYFNNNSSQNDQSVRYIEVDEKYDDLQNTGERKNNKDRPYKINYSKIGSKNQENNYTKDNEFSENKFIIETFENNNIDNFKDFDNVGKKTGKFFEFEKMENKEVNINDILDKDTVYKKVIYKPSVEKKVYNKNGNNITTITTKIKEIYKSEKPIIKKKIIANRKSFYEEFYGKEKTMNFRKKFEKNCEKNNVKKNIDIISMESENILPYDTNNDCKSYDFMGDGNSFGTDKFGRYTYQNQNTVNFNNNTYQEPRGGVFPFYKGKQINNNSNEFCKDIANDGNNEENKS